MKHNTTQPHVTQHYPLYLTDCYICLALVADLLVLWAVVWI
jgi:hypothetical protein